MTTIGDDGAAMSVLDVVLVWPSRPMVTTRTNLRVGIYIYIYLECGTISVTLCAQVFVRYVYPCHVQRTQNPSRELSYTGVLYKNR